MLDEEAVAELKALLGIATAKTRLQRLAVSDCT
jgi:hypothetical protein